MCMDWLPVFSTRSITQYHQKVMFLKPQITSATKSNGLGKKASPLLQGCEQIWGTEALFRSRWQSQCKDS